MEGEFHVVSHEEVCGLRLQSGLLQYETTRESGTLSFGSPPLKTFMPNSVNSLFMQEFCSNNYNQPFTYE